MNYAFGNFLSNQTNFCTSKNVPKLDVTFLLMKLLWLLLVVDYFSINYTEKHTTQKPNPKKKKWTYWIESIWLVWSINGFFLKKKVFMVDLFS